MSARRTKIAERSASWEQRVRRVTQSSRLSSVARKLVLMDAVGDTEPLVRIAAIEAFRGSRVPWSRPVLLAALSDKNNLVRTYAAIEISDISALRDTVVLSRHLMIARSTFRVALLAALTKVDQSLYFPKLLGYIARTSNYRDVCMAARLLRSSELSAQARNRARAALLSARRRFKSRAVNDAVREFIGNSTPTARQ